MAESKKSRKFGRNANWCKAYKLSERREKNKAIRLLRHFKRHGYTCASAVHCYNNLPMRFKPKDQLTVTHQPGKKTLKRRAEAAQ